AAGTDSDLLGRPLRLLLLPRDRVLLRSADAHRRPRPRAHPRRGGAMIPDLLCLASAPSTGPAIDRDTGREWVENELSKQEISAADLTPLEQIGRISSSIEESLGNADIRSNSPWLLLLVTLAQSAIIALVVSRVRRAGPRRTGLQLSAFDPVVSQPEPG